jgi:hypothetical protein
MDTSPDPPEDGTSYHGGINGQTDDQGRFTLHLDSDYKGYWDVYVNDKNSNSYTRITLTFRGKAISDLNITANWSC